MHSSHSYRGTSLVAVSHFVPAEHASNTALEQRLGLRSGWMEQRTGVAVRPTAPAAMPLSELAVAAAMPLSDALEKHKPGLLLLATSTPDRLLPPTAPRVAAQLGLRGIGALDVAGACSGFLYALTLAESHCLMRGEPVLVIAANILTRRVNPDDPLTAGLFADGAGAVLLKPSFESGGLLGWSLTSDGAHEDDIYIAEGGSREPYNATTFERGGHLMTMQRGPALFRHGVEAMTQAGQDAMSRANLSIDQIDWWIPHQSNGRMIDEVGKKLGFPAQRTIKTIADYGNTSAASIPMALAHAVNQRGCIQRGQTLLLTSVGSGSIAAGIVFRF